MKCELTIPKAVTSAATVEPISSLLDHGCGKGGLVELLKQDLSALQEVYRYDPGIEKFSNQPTRNWDIVISIDVLEHIGRDQIAFTLNEIS